MNTADTISSIFFLPSSIFLLLFSFHFLCASSLTPFPSPSPHGDCIPGTSERASEPCLHTYRGASNLAPPASAQNPFPSSNCSPAKSLDQGRASTVSRPPCAHVRVCMCLRQLLVLPFIDTSALGDVFTKATILQDTRGGTAAGRQAGRQVGGRAEGSFTFWDKELGRLSISISITAGCGETRMVVG